MSGLEDRHVDDSAPPTFSAGSAMKRPSVHLWVYNHPFAGISDQVAFTVSCLRQHDYTVTVGRRPSSVSLNVVIENFSAETRAILGEFCTVSRRQVAVIMTEHINWAHGRVWFHGIPLGEENDYIHPQTMVTRIQFLLECLPYVRCFMVLGDLPELQGLDQLLPGIRVRTLPFPHVMPSPSRSNRRTGGAYDCVFTGNITKFRTSILDALQEHGFTVWRPSELMSRKRRNDLNGAAKVVLNIPQRAGWKWLSSMRVIAGLVTGRPTISLGTQDTSRVSCCCTQLAVSKPDWVREFRELVADAPSLYRRNLECYNAMAERFEIEHPFPHDLFGMWAVTEGLWRQGGYA
ncbi:MAG: hypothetical protein NNA22_06465 [Nitrospira sp.]|nr:hypothetical protein [Nitrospira sp.]